MGFHPSSLTHFIKVYRLNHLVPRIFPEITGLRYALIMASFTPIFVYPHTSSSADIPPISIEKYSKHVISPLG